MINITDWSELDKEKIFSYLFWNCCLSEQHKLLYVATPKVACTSLKWWFAELEGCAQKLRETTSSAETDPDLIVHDSLYKVAPNITGLSPDKLIEPLGSDDYFRFAVVRNPYKRIFSAWQSKLLLKEPLQVGPYVDYDFYSQSIKNTTDVAKAFEGFLEHLSINEAPNYWDVHWTPQVDLLRPDLINYSKLVKIENVNELSVALSDWLGPEFVDPFAARSANESLIPYMPELITARSAELIRALYAKDFEIFGYSGQLPATKDVFTADQFSIAIKAIDIIRKRHKRLGEINQNIINLNLAISQRDSVIVERDAQINGIYSSRSWRLTRPIRLIGRLILSLKASFK